MELNDKTKEELIIELQKLQQENNYLRALNDNYISESSHIQDTDYQLLLQNIVNLLPIRVFWKDKNLKYLGCNRIFAKDAGENKPEDIIGKDDFHLTWKEQAELYRADDQNVINSGKSKINYEEQQTTPNGDKIWLRTSKVPLTDLKGNSIGVLGTYEDITEQKFIESLKTRNSELLIAKEKSDLSEKITKKFLIELTKEKEKAEESEKKYRALFESSNDAIILINNSHFFDCNTKAFNLFQCSEEYIIGKEPHLFSPEFQPDGLNSHKKADALFSKVNEGESQIFDWQHKRPNGELFDVSVSLNLIEYGKTKYVQAVLRDITEKKQIERELEEYRHNLEKLVAERTNELETVNEELKSTNEELYEKNQIVNEQNVELSATMLQLKEAQSYLIQAEKMASLGVLTAGVAHEINNPLNYIMGGYLGLDNYFQKSKQTLDEDIPILLNSIKIGIARASDIVKGLNQFSRNNETLTEECDIHSIIDNCLVMLNNQLKNRIEVEKNLTNAEFKTHGNVGKLHQVFINILTNSIQAIEKEGKISIITYKQENNSIIEISDTGCGISTENLVKITDPFFTTKDPGKGTGLGLSISYNIIQDHKGKIEFQSILNSGTTVTLTLPNLKELNERKN